MNLLIFSTHSRLFCVTYIQSQFISNPVLHIVPSCCYPLFQTNITHPAELLICFLAWSSSPWSFLMLTQHLHNPQSTFLNHASNKSYLCGLSFFGDYFNDFNTKSKATIWPERCFIVQLLITFHSASCVVCFCVHRLVNFTFSDKMKSVSSTCLLHSLPSVCNPTLLPVLNWFTSTMIDLFPK